MNTRTSLSHRVLALLLTATAAYSAYALTEPLIDKYFEQRERWAQAQLRVQKYRRLADSRPRLEAALARLREDRTAQAMFLGGSTPALASASLQEHLRALVGETEGKLHSIRALPGAARDNSGRVGISVRLSLTVEDLRTLLYALETSMPVTLVDGLSARVRYRSTGQDATVPETINVDLKLFGFMPRDRDG